MRIPKRTADAIKPLINGMSEAGVFPRIQANIANAILHEASRTKVKVKVKAK